ncbi:TonB-dependent receptor plug domain-containing protein [Pelagicoccus mobilis]|uniref:TonB-dependent receptor plug domain-containing protein n=1 Tax=Pelagicoccus mobilis TaxID=415221 RepID=A0A934RPZ4_9BACT|nr:TonB-dependent receptor plug domain-containing protein [Pelagicoccus mobilis]MBK1875350.1 hypothetical protein [Pelagicoccus mobilis]
MNKRTAFVAAGIAIATSPYLLGQDDEGDTVYELSPFTVGATENEGYRATTTLAGSRLKTDLRDVGSAISVLTKEVFEDTGATDAETVLSYALNTEVSGVHGNFANTTPANDGRVNTANARENAQGAQRVRGLAEAQLTRGFFLTDIPFDSYNTTSVTINRGPNSLLFGVGTPGGVIDNAVKSASTSRDFGSLSVRFGERGSHRESFDYNKVLIDGRLGLRVAGLNEKIEYQQRPAFEEDQRLFAAINATLFKNENSDFLDTTNLRANYEKGEIDGTPPNIIPMGDAVSDWFAEPTNVSQIAEIANWEGRGITPPGYLGNFTPKYTVDNRLGNLNSGALYSSVGPNEIPYFINIPYIYTDASSATPSVGLADPSIAGVQARVRWGVGAAQNVPDGQGNSELFATENFLGKNRVAVLAPGFAYPVIQDRNVYDNTRLLLSGNASYRAQDFEAYNVALEQTFFNNKAGIEIAFDNQSYENTSRLAFSDSQHTDLRIDISETLSNGQPNPNVGRAFIQNQGGNQTQNRLTERDAINVTAFYKLDFTESPVSWLGEHTLTGFYGTQTIDRTNRGYTHAFVDIGDTDIASAMNAKVHQFRRQIYTQVYLTDQLFGANSPVDLNITDYFRGQTPQPGDVVKVHYNEWNPIFGTDTDRLLTDEFQVERFLRSGGRSRQEIDSEVVSMQSRFFGGNLVGLIGFRSDEQTSTPQITIDDYEALTGVAGYRFDNGEFDEGALILADSGDVEKGDTVTWSLVGHIPENWLKLPGDSRLSVHYNESENFSATGIRRDFNGNILGSPSGTTTEYGGTLETLGGKLSIRLNFYETNNDLATVADPGFGFPSWVSGGMSRYKDDELGLIASGLTPEEALRTSLQRSVNFRPEILDIDSLMTEFPTWDALYDSLLNLLPETQRSRWLGFNAAGDPEWEANPGQSVTQSFVSEGIELDVVGSLTENWTVALNVGKQETVTSNTAPVSQVFVKTVFDNIKGSTFEHLIDSPVQNEAETFLGRWGRQQFNTMNALVGRDGQVSQEQRKYRVNMMTNYTFGDGRFSGFGVGGALRWQDKVATGYEIVVDDDGVVIPQLDKPFMGDDELNGDFWLSYNKKIGNDIDWKVQLNIRNLIGDKDYIPVITNPDGSVAIVRNPNPEEIFLTNTFSF